MRTTRRVSPIIPTGIMETSPLPEHTRFVLKRYAKTLPRKQYTLADQLGCHWVTVSKWLNGQPCTKVEKCNELARSVCVMYPEWRDTARAIRIREVEARLNCTTREAKIVVNALEA